MLVENIVYPSLRHVGRKHEQESLNVSSPMTEEDAVLVRRAIRKAYVASFETEAGCEVCPLKKPIKTKWSKMVWASQRSQFS
jgi:hypothetical protein